MSVTASSRIIGRIKSLSTGSGELFGGSGWQFSLQLTPWREEGCSVSFASLFVSLDGLERAEAERIGEQFAVGSIVAVSAADLTQSGDDRWSATFMGSDGIAADDELAVAQPPAVPDYVHPELGSFQWDIDLKVYEGVAEWSGREIDLTLEGEAGQTHDAAAHAVAMLANNGVWQAECLDRAWQDLGQTWLQSWAEDHEKLNSRQWQAKLSATSLSVDFEGEFSLWFDDGDLFWGHGICISGNIGGRARQAVMMG